MNQQIDLSIVTVNYNGINNTIELIYSIRKYIRLNYELIVVDNHSSNSEDQQLQQLFPEINLVKAPKNLGFAGGNNLGIKNTHSDLILMVNNDTLFIDDSIQFLIQRLLSDKHIAAVSPKIKFSYSAHPIQFAGYTKLSSITIRNRLIGFEESDKGQYDTAKPSPYLHGAAILFKKEIISTVGYIPEDYFLYYEELDWCRQIRKAGYQLYYEPQSCILHKESRSVGELSPLKIFYMTRNRLLYAKRNRKGLIKFLAISYLLFIAYPKKFVLFLLKGKFKLAKAIHQGTSSFFTLKTEYYDKSL